MVEANIYRIFIIEGLITIFFSFFVFYFCPSFPINDRRLKPEDKAALLARLEADKGVENHTAENVPWIKVIFNYKIWLMYVYIPSF